MGKRLGNKGCDHMERNFGIRVTQCIQFCLESFPNIYTEERIHREKHVSLESHAGK